MKKFSAFLLLVSALMLAGLNAADAQTIRRVNNTPGITGANIYTTLQAAHDAASAGDFIYLEPSSISYGNLTCVRPLTIIGNGYFLTENTGLQLDVRDSETGTISFAAGSAGSRITGCVITTLYIGASNVTVERNRITSQLYIGYNPQIGSVTVSNIIVRQNYSPGNFYLYPGSSAPVSNVNISNNIIHNGISTPTAQYASMTGILIANNVLGRADGATTGELQVDNAVIKNNYITRAAATYTPRNNAATYNIGAGTQFGTSNGNQQNVLPTSVFVGSTASTDGEYQLRAGNNPARGTGESGVDVGAFGGAVPYRLSGIPNVPTIYEYNQSVSGNTLNATISTRSNN
ncbi:hypothetical protein [Hymenobacter sp. B81]|uniref:hypothetical protein n=1 Tax=Hymenobacter sp. B81 TaxID=3344878 RepID=UPI0037DD5E41